MVAFRDTTTIDASAIDVAAVLRDVERWPSWTSSMSQVTRGVSGPLTVGETVTVRQPRLMVARWTVTVADISGFVWTSTAPGMRSVAEHWVTENADGHTIVALTFTMAGPLAWLAGAAYGRLIRRYLRMEAEGLRREAERRSASG